MIRLARRLSIAALITVIGCQEGDPGGPAPASTTGSTTTSTAAGGTSSTTTGGGMTAGATREPPAAAAQEVTLPSGLRYEDLVVGAGITAATGMSVSVHYTGWLTDGTRFDSSEGRAPYTLKLGNAEVIKGWDLGLVGMKVGGKRKLTIPPALGYGDAGYPGAIPPKATLVFIVELVDAR